MEPASCTLRPARPGDGAAVFEVTRRAVADLARGHYPDAVVDGWMGKRTPATYEALIAEGRMAVAECDGRVVGYVASEPGEVTRLFVLPEAAGRGLGARLLALGLEAAHQGHDGAVRLEATLNAAGFYRRQGFRELGRAFARHGAGDEPIEIVRMEL